MDKLDKVIYSIERCVCHVPDACRDCAYDNGQPYDEECVENLLKDAMELLKAQNEVIQSLRKVGYPHNFQREEPWIVNYMYAITDVIKKAVKLE